MIELENLNDQSFDEIVESAKKQISQMSDEWTDTQEADPGITLVELFAWLKVVQHNYINNIVDESQNKLFELLSIKRKYNCGSQTILNVSNISEDQMIPIGTKWYVGDMDFENEQIEQITSASIKYVKFKNYKKTTQTEYRQFDGDRIFYIFGDLKDKDEKIHERPNFEIVFDKPIAKNKIFSMYFKTFLEEQYTRNPIKPSDNFIDMAKLSWEFYGIKNGVTGWHRVRIVADNTYKFLLSGIVKFEIEGDMLPIDGGYSIRISLIDQNYDFPPRVSEIKLNTFEVRQKSTLCENMLVKKKMISKDGRFSVASNLALYGEHIVFINNDGGWKRVSNFEVKQSIEKGTVEFYIEALEKLINTLNSEDDAVMLISYDKSIKSKIVLGSGTGSSKQVIETDLQDVYYDYFDIMVGYNKEESTVFNQWEKVEDFYSSNKYDKHYILDIEKNNIIFGDHERGQAPRRGVKNIILSSLAYTKGKDSNIRAEMIKSVKSENPIINQMHIQQLTPAKNGCNSDDLEDIKNKASNILGDNQKAVTTEDYERIVRKTPGLIIEDIKVLPSDDDDSDINIIVRNGNFSKDSLENIKNYQDNIKRYLDDYRLINTRIKVSGPIYIGLKISGQIIVNSYYKQSADEVTDKIREFVGNLNKTCGQTLCYGDLFGTIDRLPCVSYVDNLRIQSDSENVSRNMTDDIIVQANAVYYIKDLDLNYVKSANI